MKIKRDRYLIFYDEIRLKIATQVEVVVVSISASI